LAREREVVITNNGKPSALMIPLSGKDFEKTVSAVRRARAKLALDEIQQSSVAASLDKMSLEEINAEIAAARAEIPA
jgi:antitoxin (DNA-binding transcriptional repressor) of toxin-antitoxin stability system